MHNIFVYYKPNVNIIFNQKKFREKISWKNVSEKYFSKKLFRK